jgi:hypothetical protein
MRVRAGAAAAADRGRWHGAHGLTSRRGDLPIFERGRIDHLALKAATAEDFWVLRERIYQAGANDGQVTDMGPLLSAGFNDPDIPTATSHAETTAGSACAVEIGGDGLHVRLQVGDQLAHSGGETGGAARDDGEGVVESGRERRGGQAVGEAGRVCVGAGEVGVAEALGDQAKGEIHELDLDARAQGQSVGLGALGELPADGVVVGGLGVV